MLPIIKRQEPSRLSDWINDFFSEGWPSLRTAALSEPAVNIAEDDDNYLIELAAPGRSKEDFSVSVTEQNTLLVRLEQAAGKEADRQLPTGEKKQECKSGECKYLRREFNYSRFEQQILLPEDIDRKGIQAKMKNGVLRITLPKLASDSQLHPAQTIAIE